ncbi:MAG TPA: preprotein translocase subunit SecG [Actinomycetota bacterium]|jgi:preprotein translocase subunit SecG
MLDIVVIVIQVLACLFLILEVLLHSGKGGGLSDMFGGGGGLSGGTSVEKTLDRITVVTAIVYGLATVYLVKFWT